LEKAALEILIHVTGFELSRSICSPARTPAEAGVLARKILLFLMTADDKIFRARELFLIQRLEKKESFSTFYYRTALGRAASWTLLFANPLIC
jgi:hypothetical protein